MLDPDKALSLLERAGALGVMALFVYLCFKGKIIVGWMHDKIMEVQNSRLDATEADRDDYKRRYLDKVDPPEKP